MEQGNEQAKAAHKKDDSDEFLLIEEIYKGQINARRKRSTGFLNFNLPELNVNADSFLLPLCPDDNKNDDNHIDESSPSPSPLGILKSDDNLVTKANKKVNVEILENQAPTKSDENNVLPLTPVSNRSRFRPSSVGRTSYSLRKSVTQQNMRRSLFKNLEAEDSSGNFIPLVFSTPSEIEVPSKRKRKIDTFLLNNSKRLLTKQREIELKTQINSEKLSSFQGNETYNIKKFHPQCTLTGTNDLIDNNELPQTSKAHALQESLEVELPEKLNEFKLQSVSSPAKSGNTSLAKEDTVTGLNKNMSLSQAPLVIINNNMTQPSCNEKDPIEDEFGAVKKSAEVRNDIEQKKSQRIQRSISSKPCNRNVTITNDKSAQTTGNLLISSAVITDDDENGSVNELETQPNRSSKSYQILKFMSDKSAQTTAGIFTTKNVSTEHAENRHAIESANDNEQRLQTNRSVKQTLKSMDSLSTRETDKVIDLHLTICGDESKKRRSRKTLHPLRRLVVNKPPNVSINGERFAHELKHQQERVLDLRMRDSNGKAFDLDLRRSCRKSLRQTKQQEDVGTNKKDESIKKNYVKTRELYTNKSKLRQSDLRRSRSLYTKVDPAAENQQNNSPKRPLSLTLNSELSAINFTNTNCPLTPPTFFHNNDSSDDNLNNSVEHNNEPVKKIVRRKKRIISSRRKDCNMNKVTEDEGSEPVVQSNHKDFETPSKNIIQFSGNETTCEVLNMESENFEASPPLLFRDSFNKTKYINADIEIEVASEPNEINQPQLKSATMMSFTSASNWESRVFTPPKHFNTCSQKYLHNSTPVKDIFNEEQPTTSKSAMNMIAQKRNSFHGNPEMTSNLENSNEHIFKKPMQPAKRRRTSKKNSSSIFSTQEPDKHNLRSLPQPNPLAIYYLGVMGQYVQTNGRKRSRSGLRNSVYKNIKTNDVRGDSQNQQNADLIADNMMPFVQPHNASFRSVDENQENSHPKSSKRNSKLKEQNADATSCASLHTRKRSTINTKKTGKSAKSGEIKKKELVDISQAKSQMQLNNNKNNSTISAHDSLQQIGCEDLEDIYPNESKKKRINSRKENNSIFNHSVGPDLSYIATLQTVPDQVMNNESNSTALATKSKKMPKQVRGSKSKENQSISKTQKSKTAAQRKENPANENSIEASVSNRARRRTRSQVAAEEGLNEILDSLKSGTPALNKSRLEIIHEETNDTHSRPIVQRFDEEEKKEEETPDLITWLRKNHITRKSDQFNLENSFTKDLTFKKADGVEFAFYNTKEQACLGYLRFEANQKRRPKHTKKFVLHFICMFGQFEIKISTPESGNWQTHIINRNHLCIVEKDSVYTIENLTNEVGILQFFKQ